MRRYLKHEIFFPGSFFHQPAKFRIIIKYRTDVFSNPVLECISIVMLKKTFKDSCYE